MQEFFHWLNDLLLRMQWLSDAVAILVRDVLGMDMTRRTAASVHFFVYDVIKIFILLSVLIFLISYAQSYFSAERTRLEKITDIVDIASYGVMSTPGLVINDKVVSAGRVLPEAEIVQLLQEA